MATVNIQAPFGFKRFGTASGPPNFAENSNPPYRIASGYGTAIYFGDAVRMNVSGPTGYVERWTAADGGTATQILVGIFQGCQYFSTARKQTVVSNYWPGTDATGDVTAFIADDPNSQWMVQASTGPITYASIGATADIGATPVGSTVTGISAMCLATPTTTVTFPFKVINVVVSPPGAPGTDIASAYNNVIVAFNNQQYKALLGV